MSQVRVAAVCFQCELTVKSSVCGSNVFSFYGNTEVHHINKSLFQPL